ncbi:hypothetical protein DFH07DRAFT_259983 [Mycena maculata]|uniref:GYF domain-containing protein n=1 Tax=Mycena maculata TaxID=230809 RepID=A0AAD7NQK4_9AGAR|nr:hypothetical protein DFH07DRAFT_259983 [Mycena maculata]
MSTVHSMQSMQFGPEWMRAKPAKPHGPSPPPPPATAPAAGASSYSALVSPAPPPPTEKRDESHPFRYSRDEMLKIYRDGGGKSGLGLEVERWEGIVRETASDPVGLREMGESEKKLFAGSLNSELRRRQSIDYLSPLSTQGTPGERPRLPHSASSGAGSPLRERFGGLMRRRDSSDQLSSTMPRKLSLSSTQAPLSPRDAALPSPRTRIGHTPTFDGVLNGGDSWMARRRASEAKSVGNASRDPEGRGSEIREEDEDVNPESGGDTIPREIPQKTESPSQDPQPSDQPKAGDGASYSPLVQNGADLAGITVPNGPPPGIRDLAGVQWSYLDPQGQLQGPFRADLMQKWYDDGYFTADLLMKRTHHDVDWVAVGELTELARMSGSEKLFLSQPVPPGPPGLSRPSDFPGHAPKEQNTYNGPLQPAPVRSLRSSTLDAYVGGSSHSDSPSSSFGAGRFGNGSPDSHGFGGRANNQYSSDPAVGSRFGASDSASSLRRNTFNDPALEPSVIGSRFAGGAVGDVYATNGSYSPSQGPWQASSSNLSGPFDTLNGGFGSSSNLPTSLSQASGFGHIRTPQDSPFGEVAPTNFPDYLGGPQAGAAPFGPSQQYSHLHSSPYTPQSPGVAPNPFGQPAKSIPQPTAQNSGIPAVPAQSPWGAVPDPASTRRAAPFDSVRPAAHTAISNGPPTPLQASPWGTTTQTSEPSPWFAASQGVVDEHSWKEERGHSLTFSNLGQHNQQFTSAPDETVKAPVLAEVAQPVETSDIDVPAKPPAAPTQRTKRSKSTAQPVAPPPIAPAIPAAETTPAVPAAPKPAWAKEEEAKRPKPSGVTLSLRDIQDAEAKKAEARKVTERDRERAARASSSTGPAPEEAQPFTASWGLPTSQAGARAAPAKETAAASPTTGGAPAVWTNATKPNATKKTMKEIQEEEEKRKKLATKETAAAAARRAYAESTSKAPPPSAQGAAWTTVGASKSSNPVAAPVRPPLAPAASSTSTSVPRANGVAAPRAAPAPAKAPAPRVEDHPATASHEFLRWLNDSLKGLNNSVNVEEIMSMLLSFPLDPDASTVELISDLIYANSTTLDGRRFAAEFVSRRKADAAARPKGASVAGGAAGKPVSIADVVKAQPKPPASAEWGGFKVVNKKKKGGRS